MKASNGQMKSGSEKYKCFNPDNLSAMQYVHHHSKRRWQD